jgi:hypothetical protein
MITWEFTILIGVATLCFRIPGLKLKAIQLTEMGDMGRCTMAEK